MLFTSRFCVQCKTGLGMG